MFVGIDVGLKNLSLCFLKEDGAISDWKLVDCRTHDRMTISEATRSVVLAMRKLQLPKDAIVGVEQQPCGGRTRNTIMRCIQAGIEGWAITAGIYICGIAAARKLGKNAPKKYSDRKKQAVFLVKEKLDAQWLAFFQTHHKRDDLADSFLLANVLREQVIIERKKIRKRIAQEAKRYCKKIKLLDKANGSKG